MGGHGRPGYVLITGCTTGGIGHSLALEFHERGYRVIATARNLARMQDLVDREDFDTLQLDVSSSESIAAAKEAVQAITGGYLDVLVNSAEDHSKPAIELGDAEDLQVFDLNFHAAVRMVTAFSPLILASAPHSKIVNISSVGGSLPVPFLGMYRAAKSALNAYSDTLRVELAPFGVDVLTVMTGTVSNSKDMGIFPLRLAPNSPYKPLEETFPKVMLEANANQTHGSDYARAVVAETRKRRPRAVQWTGAQALLAWILATLVPRFVIAFILSRMWGLDKLGRSSTQAAHQQNRPKDD